MAVRDMGMALWRQRPFAALVSAVAVAGGVGWLLLTPLPSARPLRWLAVAGVVLAVLAVTTAAALLRDRSTRTVDDAVTVEEAAGAPLLGHLDRPADLTVMPALDPGSAGAGAFRHLRATLESRAATGSSRVVFAGATGGDVNVWVGANAALALAAAGRRVLLVDGRMGERWGTPIERGPDTPGLYDVLSGADLPAALSAGPVDGLEVLPAGTYGSAPVAELIDRRFATVMSHAAGRFDHIVVIGPPLDVCDDACAMAADGLLVLAVVEGSVSPSALRSQAARARSRGADLTGVVLVGVERRRRTAP